MSLLVALQSVLYYVLACSACRKCAYQRKRKREAILAKQRQDGGDLETGNHSSYRHTSPFSTNIYWREELALGPGPPQKKTGKEGKGNQRRLTTSGTGSSVASSSSHGEPLGHGGVTSPPPERTKAEDWYYKRHQREDEMLWGYQHSSSQDQGLMRQSSVELRRGRTDTTAPKSYYRVRSPPLTELHPPVVSAHSSDKDEMRWMLQPPPNARIMSGKEGVKNDRSSCGSSRTIGDLGLGRQLGVKLMEEKKRLRRRDPGISSMERCYSQQMTGQRHDRNISSKSDAMDQEIYRIQTKRHPPSSIWINDDPPRISTETTGTSGLTQSSVAQPGHSDVIAINDNTDPSKDVHFLQPPTPSFPATSNSSIPSQHILQELIPPINQNNTASNTISPSPPHSKTSVPDENSLRPSISNKDTLSDDNDDQRRRMKSLMMMNRWSMDI